jgi:outer membrane protein assembly factor BamD (BamD/ComL family)
MSIASIASGSLAAILTPAPTPQFGQGKFQQIQAEFQQLGQDLQTGNLSQAEQDYATLSQNFPVAQSSTTASTANNASPIAQAFNALSQDLQNGNISAAQQDYATIQQDFQQQQQQGAGQVHHHHHHGGGGGGQQNNQISQALNSLSSALQAGNLSSAQTAFATLQQDLQQFESGGSNSSGGRTPSYAAAGSLNVTA